jgi:hypothetical protein
MTLSRNYVHILCWTDVSVTTEMNVEEKKLREEDDILCLMKNVYCLLFPIMLIMQNIKRKFFLCAVNS